MKYDFHKKMPKKLSQEEFIIRSNKVHNNLYDYSLCIYKTTHETVKILCPEHGEFEQTPAHHLQGHKCKFCANNVTYTINKFIEDAVHIHGNKYDYSKGMYKNSKSKIEISCPQHGSFFQSYDKHVIQKHGCPKCRGQHGNKVMDVAPDLEDEYADAPHNSKKFEDLTTGTNYKACWICRNCDKVWWARVNYRIDGIGCPYCSKALYSKASIKLWNIIMKKEKIFIQHAENKGEYHIPNIGNVDGYCVSTNTVYEYHGCYWHGCPKCKNPNFINANNKLKFKHLYANTQQRDDDIKKLGFNLITIWECDAMNILNYQDEDGIL